ncbi:MAG: sulfite exporter TauE/SafE family protein [Actinomycetota bacterium]|nr:sulfite exporter TauE/SafE family protein [Actinomycetota bacterium]
MELALFCLWCFLVALAGGLVGLVLGNIRLPATLLVAGSAAAGTGANLLISAAAAATAAIAHIRAGRISWRLFAWMAPPSVAFAFLGGYLSGVLPRAALLLVISAVLLYSAFDLSRWTPPDRGAPGDAPGRVDYRTAAVAGAFIGLLGGVVGLILGSLRMPALLRLAHVAPARAAGTNVAVGFWVGVAGAIGHLPSAPPDWRVAAYGAAASIPGALLGSRLTGRLSEVQLVRAIAAVLLVAGIATAVEALA